MKGRRIMAMAAALCLACIALSIPASAGEPETIYIAEGGHYAVGPLYYYGVLDVWVNMTVQSGGPVDIYLMSMSQYENSYPDSGPALTFSAKNQSMENVSSAAIHLQLNYSYEPSDMVYVVIDNRNLTLTPNDAMPQGQVAVVLEVDSTGDYGFDDFIGDDFPVFLCVAAPLIAIIILVAILVLAMRSSSKASQPPPYPPLYPGPPPIP